MASIRKRGQKWQAQIRLQNRRPVTKSFTLKSDAEQWARETEIELQRGSIALESPKQKKMLLADVLTRYRNTVTVKKRGAGSEIYRLRTLLADEISQVCIKDLSSSHVASYRDRRLAKVSGSSVRRELGVLRHCLKVGINEWELPLKTNPVTQIEIPPDGRERERRVNGEELRALLAAAKNSRNPLFEPIIRFAVATGMRRGEIVALKWDDIDLEARTARIRESKNGHPRTVPLAPEAKEVLEDLPRTADRVFPITANALRQGWERIKARAGVDNLHFHDLRHEAISRFFEAGLSIAEVSLISGHRDVRMLFRYTHPKAEEVARKLKKET